MDPVIKWLKNGYYFGFNTINENILEEASIVDFTVAGE